MRRWRAAARALALVAAMPAPGVRTRFQALDGGGQAIDDGLAQQL